MQTVRDIEKVVGFVSDPAPRLTLPCLTLIQPWASLIAENVKTIETRKWQRPFRGAIVICAGLKDKPAADDISNPNYGLPFGVALCIADVVDWRPMTQADERAACCGIYPGAYSMKLQNVRRIHPVPVRGAQGIFERTITVDWFDEGQPIDNRYVRDFRACTRYGHLPPVKE